MTLSIIFGVIAAVKRYSVLDNAVTFLALFGQSVPNFWLGIMLILIFAVRFGWLPSQGYGGFSPRYFLLPMMTLAAPGLARLTRLVRSGMLDVMDQDYVRTARAKGLKEMLVIFRHGLKNAAIPLVTVIGLDFGKLLAGAVITEQIFQWRASGNWRSIRSTRAISRSCRRRSSSSRSRSSSSTCSWISSIPGWTRASAWHE